MNAYLETLQAQARTHRIAASAASEPLLQAHFFDLAVVTELAIAAEEKHLRLMRTPATPDVT